MRKLVNMAKVLVLLLGVCLINSLGVSEAQAQVAGVVWKDLVGVSANGNTITKTAASGWGNGGASSQNIIPGDGNVDFAVTQTSVNMMLGLATSDPDQNYPSINYAVYLYFGTVYIYQSGSTPGSYGAFQAGDRFQVERTGTTVRYKKNNVTFYTSAIASSGNLLVDTAINNVGGIFSDVMVTGANPVPNNPPVANAQNATVNQDTPKAITLTGNDPEGSALVFTVVGSPAHGTLSGTAPNVTYTPNSGYLGSDSFTFKVNDGTVDSSTAAVSITVQPPPTGVVWQNLVGVSVSGNTITKTAASAWGNGGAASNSIIPGDGGVNFLADDTGTHRIAGLSPGNIDANYATIRYGLYLAGGTLQVYESGALIGSFGSYVAGDRFSVERAGTTVSYKKNNVTFYTSAVASSGNVLVDTAIYTQGATVADANINGGIPAPNNPPVANAQNAVVNQDTPKAITLTGSDPEGNSLVFTVVGSPAHGTLSGTAPNLTYTPAGGYLGSDSFTFKVNDGTQDSSTAAVSITVQVPPVPVPVIWKDLVGVSANGNIITKTAVSGWGNGGAASVGIIPDDGGVGFLTYASNTHQMAGLSPSNIDANYATIKYALYLAGGSLQVYESGSPVGSFGSYVAGDQFSVERSGTTVSYKKNGTTFYTSTVASSGDLLVDASLYTLGGNIADATITGGAASPGVPDSITNLSAVASDGQAALSWSAPNINGSPIVAYVVQYGTTASGLFNNIFTDNNVPGATISGLTNGAAYQFRVIARNGIGDSVPSNVATATPQADPTVAVVVSPAPGTTLSVSSNVTFNWSAVSGATGYQLTIGTSVGANNIADSGVTASTGFNVTNVPLNGNPVYVRMTTYIGGTTKVKDYVYATSATPVVTFTGSGSDSKFYTGSGITQSVSYTLDASFTLATANPVVNGSVTSYSLPRKTGTIHFQGSASSFDSVNQSTQTFNFDKALTIDVLQTEGTFSTSQSNPEDVNAEFNIPASGTNYPYAVHVRYVGLERKVYVTFQMPFPWNNNGGVDNIYSVSAVDDAQGACSITVDPNELSLMPGDTKNIQATTFLKNGDVLQWQLTPDENSTARAVITTDATGKKAVVSDVKGKGTMTLKAINPSVINCRKEFPVRVNECPSCNVGSQTCSNGTCGTPNNTLRAEVSLGRSTFGNSFGIMFINAKVPLPALASPESLKIQMFGNDNRVIYAGTKPRQIVTDENLVDIVVLTPYKYEIRYYALSSKGPMVNGVYTIIGGAAPLKVWAVENPDASASVYNRLKLTESGPSMTDRTYEYVYSQSLGTWELSKGNGLTVATTSEQASGGNRIVTETLKNNAGTAASVTRTTYGTISTPTGTSEEVLSTVEDPNGAASTTTTSFYQNSSDPGYGQIASVVYPDGSWVRYEYDTQGRKIRDISSWLDAPVGTLASSAREVSYNYSSQSASDAMAAEDNRKPRLVTEKILGQTVAKTFYVYQITNGQRTDIAERAGSVTAAYGDAGNLRTTTLYVPNSPWRVLNVTNPDGTRDTYQYETGTYTPNANPAQPGTFTPGAGSYERETVTHGTTGSPSGVANKTGAERIVRNSLGEVLLQERLVYNGSSLVQIAWTVNRYDGWGHLTIVNKSDGTQSDNTWGAGTLQTAVDSVGTEHRYTYDLIGRLQTSVKEAGTDDVTTTYAYDGAGRRLSETTTSAALSTATSSTYDLAGRLATSTDAAGLVTTYTYSPDNRTTTVTRPGGAQEITTQYIDGQMKSATGSGVVAQYLTAGVNADGTRWTQVNHTSAVSPNYEKTTVDMLGRTIQADRPGFSGVESTQSFYNNLGQLVRTTTTGQAATLYEYDSVGNQVRSGLDRDASGTLVLNSTDRIADTNTVFTLISTNYWQQTTQSVYAQNNATPTTTGVSRSRLSGFTGGVVDETVSTDINGNVTTATTAVNRATKTQTRTVDVPDSDTNAVSVTVNGLQTSNTSQSNVTTTFAYDKLERPTGVTDPRAGTTTTAYSPTTGQVTSVTDPGSRITSFTYDTAGRKATETNALNQVTRFEYNNLNQVVRTWGDVPYPVEYVYDAYGRMTTMRTWRTSAAWTGATWPSGVASPETTTWNYQEATGLLTSKVDDSNRSTVYTYTTGGKLLTRVWARTPAITTTYGYDTNTAELLTVNYSDATPDVTFTYDRLGRPSSVIDGLGTRTLAYNTALAPLTETITGLYSKVITRTYATTGVIGRPTGFNTGAVYSNTYGYDTKGRLNSVAWTITGAAAGSATYAYTANSDLLATLTRGTRVTTYTYEPTRDLKSQVRNQVGATTVSQYAYINDAIGRRTSVVNTGTGFAASAFSLFGYNNRSELTVSNRYLGTNIAVLTSPVPAETRAFTYDTIGNRTNMTVGTTAGTFTANNLNQYTAQTGPANTFTHDFDGNLSQITGTRNVVFTYDGENRLLSVQPVTPVANNKRLEFVYDYQGRRVQKLVYNRSGSSWVLQTTKRFVYDGWNMVEEQTVSGTTKYYVYGLDLSQSLQGAGGVGGLLAKAEGAATHQYFYDANGNISQMINASSGAVDARYEYDAYGNSILATGTQAAGNTMRFSTKYLDTEFSLYYYGYRYYDPATGRWVNRDPIEEDGGLNLYAFVLNGPINQFDAYGETTETLSSVFKKGTITYADFENAIKNNPAAKGLMEKAYRGTTSSLRGAFSSLGAAIIYVLYKFEALNPQEMCLKAIVDDFKGTYKLNNEEVQALTSLIRSGVEGKEALLSKFQGSEKLPIYWVLQSEWPNIYENTRNFMNKFLGGSRLDILNYNGRLSPQTELNRALVATLKPFTPGKNSLLNSFDEYPMASTIQGGKVHRVSVRWVYRLEQSSQGGVLSGMYRGYNMNATDPFLVITVPREGIREN